MRAVVFALAVYLGAAATASDDVSLLQANVQSHEVSLLQTADGCQCSDHTSEGACHEVGGAFDACEWNGADGCQDSSDCPNNRQMFAEVSLLQTPDGCGCSDHTSEGACHEVGGSLDACTWNGSDGVCQVSSDCPNIDERKMFAEAEAEEGTYYAKFVIKHSDGSQGSMMIRVHEKWAPWGAQRFKLLMDSHFFDGTPVFKISDRGAEIGGASNTSDAAYAQVMIPDDAVVKTNQEGYLSFAQDGPNTRSNALYVNFRDNSATLDAKGWAPFAKIIMGEGDLKKAFRGYAASPPGALQLKQMKAEESYPKASYVESVRFWNGGR